MGQVCASQQDPGVPQNVESVDNANADAADVNVGVGGAPARPVALFVHVKTAENLRNDETIGSPDGYAEIDFPANGQEEVQSALLSTPVVHNTCSPVWNFKTTIMLAESVSSFRLTVKNYNYLVKDSELGRVDVDVPDHYVQKDEVFDLYDDGKLFVSFVTIPVMAAGKLVPELQDKLNENNSNITQIQTELASLAKSNELDEAQKEELKKDLEELAAQMEEEDAKHQEEMAQLSSNIDEAVNAYAQKQKELEVESARLAESLKKQKEQAEALESHAAMLQQEVDRRQEHVNERNSQMEKMNAQLESLKATSAEQEGDAEAMKAKNDEILAALKDVTEKLQATGEEVKGLTTQLEQKHNEKSAVEARRITLQHENTQKDADIANLHSTLAQKQSESANLRQQLQESRNKNGVNNAKAGAQKLFEGKKFW